jgi:hypothetical protein
MPLEFFFEINEVEVLMLKICLKLFSLHVARMGGGKMVSILS